MCSFSDSRPEKLPTKTFCPSRNMKNKWSEWCLHVNAYRTQLNYKQNQASITYWPWIKRGIPRLTYLYKTKRKRGDSSNKGCLGRKTNLFRESGDFAGNRETWEIFREIWDIFGTLSKDLILHVIKQYIYSDMHPVYALYSMYFDTWKRLNSPWYEKTNQQRFQLK